MRASAEVKCQSAVAFLLLRTFCHAGRCCMDQQLSPERLLSDFSKIPSA